MDLICRLFYGNNSGLSKAQYYRKHKLIKFFYRWLCDENFVSENVYEQVCSLKMGDVVSDHMLDLYYFKDLDSAINFVSHIGALHGMNSPDDLLNVKSLIILSWHGLNASEISLIRKVNLDKNNCSVLIPEISKCINIPNKYFRIIERFAELDLYRLFPSQATYEYMVSPYLMRSARSRNLSENNIRHVIKRFNESGDYGKKLSLLELRKNGIFQMLSEHSNGDNYKKDIKEILDCDNSFAFGYREFYLRWKSKYL
jgi:site-specific recombinase XerD